MVSVQRLNLNHVLTDPRKVPLPCYLMQGEHPLPQAVIEKFSKTGGELCDNVFLLSTRDIIGQQRALLTARQANPLCFQPQKVCG